VYRDIIPGCGPLGGIYTALNNFDSDWLAVLPVDMPLLDAEIYFHLWKQREDQRPVVAKTKKGIESMVSLWHKSNLSFIEERIKIRQWSIYRVLNEMNAVQVNFPPEKQIQFFNINYKEDLELLKSIRKSGGG
ncbi:MAG: molybdenum cofactor guanylyltransferase, partial [Calditrichaeota bacterium]|nr:molybdenum cofactor guanylyltransferase [Calditrichota bacterium]